VEAGVRADPGLRASAAPANPNAPPDPIVRRFWTDGRLVVIPAKRAKRLLVLDWVAQAFEPGRLYSENYVNAVLRRYHPDFAALRRYLVDEGFMDRRDGDYWRIGGTFEVT
jgi:hypothetical protein